MKSKKELLKMPVRKWDDTSREYKSILLVPTGKKHDSGYMHIAVIGVYAENKIEKYEIAAFPDDISCLFPLWDLGEEIKYSMVRMDCFYPSGVLQYHGPGVFKVSLAVASIEITFIPFKK